LDHRNGLARAVIESNGASAAKAFVRIVDGDYAESWMEGMDVYHNPRPNTLSIPQWSWGQHITVSSVMAGSRA
jgi:hypothetical protein